MPTSKDLRFYYGGASSAGGVLPSCLIDASSTSLLLISTDLDGTTDDYYNGSIGYFLSGTLEDEYFHVKDYDGTSQTLTLAKALSGTPAEDDHFAVIKAGLSRSTTEVPGLTVTAGPTDVTGVTIDYAGYANGEGSGTLAYTSSTTSVTWTGPSDSAGPAVDVSTSGTYYLYSDDDSMFLEITVVAASLPAGDESDTITLARPEKILLPDASGAETAAGTVRYYDVWSRAGDGLSNVDMYIARPAGSATTTTTDCAIDADDTVTVTSAASWDSSGFIYNSTKTDLRYYYGLSGNTMSVKDPDGGIRGFTAAAWDIGDTVEPYPTVDTAVDDDDGTSELADLTYTNPTSSSKTTVAATLSSGSAKKLALRETIVAGTKARADVLSQLKFSFE